METSFQICHQFFILSSDPGPQGDPLPPRGELSLE